MADNIEDRIEQAAIKGVQRVVNDGTAVDAMPIADRILAAKFVAEQKAAAKPGRGIQRTIMTPGGCG